MSVDSTDTDVEEETDTAAEAPDVAAMGRELGEAIADLPEYRAFEAASEAVEESEEAQKRIREFEQKRREFTLARQTGDVSGEEMADLKRAQQELHSMPVMEEFLEAREELVDRLEAVNEAISEPLSVDFGEEAGGCCQDDADGGHGHGH